jgi:polysaccharide chain length determinant protein (PEP-CTERM system associated)
MLGHRDLTTEDYADIFKRRFWLIAACAIGLFALGVVLSYVIPPSFISQTLVLIERPQVPEDYVKPVVTEDLEQRLASMKEQILSRSRLQPIIEQYNLFGGGNFDMDDRVAMTQKAIGIRPIPSGRGGMPGFYITFTARNPHIAQDVCGRITSLFVVDNSREREQTAEGTADFLKQQLADAKKTLDEQDAKLAAFQQAHFGMLPDQQNSNANNLQALTTQMNAATEALSRMQQNITFLQAMISQQSEEQASAPGGVVGVQDDRKRELQSLIDQKKALDAQYTPDYPDVIAISRKIADLQAEIAQSPVQAAAVAAAAPSSDSPQLQQLKAQLRAAQQSMADERQQQAHIEQEIRTYEGRIESTPRVDEEYKQITRDHDTALQFYNSLLAKMNESSMATALEQRNQGEQFRVIDPPNLPDEPSFPNRVVFAAGGLAGGMILGLLLAGLFEYRDTSLRNEKDVWAFTKLPTLAMISHVHGLGENNPSNRRWWNSSPSNKSMESASR